MAVHRIEETGGKHRVRHGVLPIFVIFIARLYIICLINALLDGMNIWMMPAAQIPFIKGNLDLPVQTHRRQQAPHLTHGMIHSARIRHALLIIRQIIHLSGHIPVFMNRDPVQKFTAMLQQIDIPVYIRQRGGGKLDRGVNMLHHLRGFFDESAPFLRGFGADLPKPVILVSDAPVLDRVGLRMPIFDAFARIASFMFQIAVFNPIAHLFGGSRSRVGTNVRLAAKLAAQVDIFIRAKGVGVFNAPRLIKRRYTRSSNAILPVIGRNKTPAGPAQYRHLDFAHRLHDIPAQAAFIGKR